MDSFSNLRSPDGVSAAAVNAYYDAVQQTQVESPYLGPTHEAVEELQAKSSYIESTQVPQQTQLLQTDAELPCDVSSTNDHQALPDMPFLTEIGRITPSDFIDDCGPSSEFNVPEKADSIMNVALDSSDITSQQAEQALSNELDRIMESLPQLVQTETDAYSPTHPQIHKRTNSDAISDLNDTPRNKQPRLDIPVKSTDAYSPTHPQIHKRINSDAISDLDDTPRNKQPRLDIPVESHDPALIEYVPSAIPKTKHAKSSKRSVIKIDIDSSEFDINATSQYIAFVNSKYVLMLEKNTDNKLSWNNHGSFDSPYKFIQDLMRLNNTPDETFICIMTNNLYFFLKQSLISEDLSHFDIRHMKPVGLANSRTQILKSISVQQDSDSVVTFLSAKYCIPQAGEALRQACIANILKEHYEVILEDVEVLRHNDIFQLLPIKKGVTSNTDAQDTPTNIINTCLDFIKATIPFDNFCIDQQVFSDTNMETLDLLGNIHDKFKITQPRYKVVSFRNTCLSKIFYKNTQKCSKGLLRFTYSEFVELFKVVDTVGIDDFFLIGETGEKYKRFCVISFKRNVSWFTESDTLQIHTSESQKKHTLYRVYDRTAAVSRNKLNILIAASAYHMMKQLDDRVYARAVARLALA
ncbi:hypothetical protein [Neodiprion sertifer nucleopolyhedrovirus]|uniref:Uncharacterized protein n=1 Tax=Neodiprion sertifer nucleopolyhedrovirus TaxID=111874 RepID=Q6JKE4_9CBAC|nr:hypothetical protein NeseNPV_gp16 [Neodiprion sertifer nucleopolyhedrovirus]AAQ96393.1 hypothetical protein [Neodiprion sertifer nucleopolyhedrovirus]